MLRICVVLVSLAVQDEPKPLPELQPFLAEFRKTLHSDSLLLSQYTYTEKETVVTLDSDQKPKKTEVNVFEVYPNPEDWREYRRQIVKDGKPVPQPELEKKDRDQKKKVESEERKRKKKTPEELAKIRAGAEREDDKAIGDIFAMYEIRIVRRESRENHPTILLNFKPRPRYKPKTKNAKIMQHMAGNAWVSEDDHELVRLELEIIEPISIGFGMLAKLHKGAHVAAERRKINDEVWLPEKVEAEVSGRIFMLKGINIRQVTEYSGHKKFSVETILKFPGTEKEK